MKYIMFTDAGREVPIIFSNGIEHKRIANAIKNEFEITPRSAGFINIVSDFDNPGKLEAVCFGKSISLDLKTHSEDRIIINSLINKKD